MRLSILLAVIMIACVDSGKNREANQIYFAKKQAYCENGSLQRGYRLLLKDDTTALYLCSYLETIRLSIFTEREKILMIEELLRYEKDTSGSAMAVTCYNPKISQYYIGNIQSYTLQVEALYLINIIAFQDPFNYAPYPLLIDKKSGKINTGDIISQSYKSYKKWLNRVKDMGLQSAETNDIRPLSGNISWYR